LSTFSQSVSQSDGRSVTSSDHFIYAFVRVSLHNEHTSHLLEMHDIHATTLIDYKNWESRDKMKFTPRTGFSYI